MAVRLWPWRARPAVDEAAAEALARAGAGLSGINDPSTPLYQALVNLENGISFGGAGNAELPGVTVDTSVRIAAVYRSAQLLGRFAGLPLAVIQHGPDGKRQVVKDPGDAYIWRKPNPATDRVTFWKTATAHNALAGESFFLHVFDGAGRTAEVWCIHPKRVQVHRDPETWEPWYEVDGEFVFRDLAYGGEMSHSMNLTIDGRRGVGPIQVARMAWQLSRAMEEHQGQRLANGAIPGGIIQTTADLGGEEGKAKVESLKANWNAFHKGTRNAGRVGVIDNGATFKELTMSLADLQFLELRRFQLQEIARLFGIPPHLLADSSNSTSWGSGLEEQTRGFVTYTMGDYTDRFEELIENGWLYRAGRTNRSAKWNYGALLRGGTLQRYQAYGLAVDRWMTRNEVRALEDLPPVEGGDLLGEGGDDGAATASVGQSEVVAQLEALKGMLGRALPAA